MQPRTNSKYIVTTIHFPSLLFQHLEGLKITLVNICLNLKQFPFPWTLAILKCLLGPLLLFEKQSKTKATMSHQLM